MSLTENIQKAAEIMRNSRFVMVFTGAGISVESGIPPFRGPTGLWSRYDPNILDLDEFCSHPEKSWPKIKEIFYDFYTKAEPNPAHYAVAKLEQLNVVKSIITQNIDNLHQKAGAKNVSEYHGTLNRLICQNCYETFHFSSMLIENLPAKCPNCEGLLKPDFVFFGEPIPLEAAYNASTGIDQADVILIIGTTGEIMPACMIPRQAKRKGATIIEINIEESKFTNQITDIFLEGEAGKILPEIVNALENS